MRLYEYMVRNNFLKLSPDQQQFVSKMIIRESKRVAKELGVTEEKAYMLLSMGLHGGDRMIDVVKREGDADV